MGVLLVRAPFVGVFVVVAVFVALVSCKPSISLDDRLRSLGKNPEQIALYKKGKAVYQAGCASCHHSNPSLEGAVGPAVFGSSRELLAARIVDGSYPAGYQPKRATRAMLALPHYKNDIEALFEFLNVTLP